MKKVNDKSQKANESRNQSTKQQTSQIEELTNDLKRVQAEFVNYKNRAENEKAILSQFSKVQVIKDLLPVIDDLQRALHHVPEELKDNKWAQGTQKVYDRLQKQLEKLGVKKIEALHQVFNPVFHEAVQAEGDGEQEIISEVLQDGYTLGDVVVRYATVKVERR